MLDKAILQIISMIIYKQHREGLFSIHSGKWGVNGWEDVEEVHAIIGETRDHYITKIIESSIPYWDEMGRYEAHSCTPIGIHKSRFIRWMDTQLSLF